ncbi:MAG: hypothetical protein ABFS19_14990, partial [Thermodesulfobacteriota bacterium]
TGQAEKDQDAHFAPLQQGIFDGVSAFAVANRVLGYEKEDLKPWLNYLLVTKLAFPRTAEVKNIRHQHHLDDFYGKNSPSNKKTVQTRELWSSSLFALHCNPVLRLRFFLSAIRARLRE